MISKAEQLEVLLNWREDPRRFIERFFYIRDKQRRRMPLLFNYVQQEYYAHRTTRDIILKPRQMGFTTVICALFLADTLLHGNTHSVIVAHNAESAEAIFEIVRFTWKHLPPWWHRNHSPGRSNRGELYWPTLDSRFSVGTALSLAVGRGQTINNLLCSELAHWRKPEEALTSLLAAVPAVGRVVIESTPFGIGGHFHDLWTKARRRTNEFSPHFYVWFEDPSYRLPGPPLDGLSTEESELRQEYGLDDDQLRWRRAMQREFGLKFAQEFPENDRECFLASGACCFPTAVLARMREEARKDPGRLLSHLILKRYFQCEIKELGPVGVLPGRLTVWRDPEQGKHYRIGADVAEGLETGNFSAAVVVEKESGQQVAELHGHWPPHVFARLLAALGAWYRWARLAVESNGHGHTALHVLRHELYYPHLHYHVDTVRGGRPHLGWVTDARTKPKMIDDLVAAVAEGKIGIRSVALTEECLTFVSKDDGVQEAQAGEFDDLVIAAAIAWQMYKRPISRMITERPAGW